MLCYRPGAVYGRFFVQQMAFLRDLGCDPLQGFLFSPAVSAVDFQRMVLEGAGLDLECDSKSSQELN